METKVKIAAVKKRYTIFADEETRGFIASMKRLQKDAADAEAAQQAVASSAAVKAAKDAVKAAKDAEAKKAAEAALKSAEAAAKEAKKAAADAESRKASSAKAKAALEALADVMQRKNLHAADINKDYLLQNLPLRFNAAQQVCTVKMVAAEAEADVKKEYENTPALLIERDNHLFIYKPILLFTSNTFFNLFCSAADAKKKAESEASSAADKEAKAAAKQEKLAKEIEAWRKKIAAFDAAQQESK